MSDAVIYSAVNHPSHYTFGDIEVIDYIRDKLTPDEFIGYCIGNVMKYISRWRHKAGKEDLEKAEVYLRWAIERANDDPIKLEDPSSSEITKVCQELIEKMEVLDVNKA